MAAAGPEVDAILAVVSPELFGSIERACLRDLKAALVLCLPDGKLVLGSANASCNFPLGCQQARSQAAAESLRWGEPCIQLCACGRAMWAVPVMANQRALGALVIQGVVLEKPGGRPGVLDRKVKAGCERLLQLAISHNLTNAAMLRQHQLEARRERERAEALHETKGRPSVDLLAACLREEGTLLGAVGRGDAQAARACLHRLLAAFYRLGISSAELRRGFALEVLHLIGRAASRTGTPFEVVFRRNLRSGQDVAKLEGGAELESFLAARLDEVLAELPPAPKRQMGLRVARALRFMEEHLGDNISREDVAQAAGVSRSHFSRMFHATTGRPFVDMLAQFRVDRAQQLLRHSDKNLSRVAMETGFSDQSYFTRVFRRFTGETPHAYRRRVRGGAGMDARQSASK